MSNSKLTRKFLICVIVLIGLIETTLAKSSVFSALPDDDFAFIDVISSLSQLRHANSYLFFNVRYKYTPDESFYN